MKNILFISIIIIIIYLIYNINAIDYKNTIIENNIINNNINNYLEGYWISDNNFLKLSDIDNLILYTDIINNFGYLIIVKNKQIVHNIEFNINFNKNNIIIDNNNDLNNILFDISFISEDPEFIWQDKEFKCILSINDGNLKLFNGETLYANLFKDNKISYYLKNV